MESLEGYSYYDTPRGPQYVRNGANDNIAEDRRRGPTKYHPYAQNRRYDRLTNSPIASNETDGPPATDHVDYTSVYGSYGRETVSPQALTSRAQVVNNSFYQDPSIEQYEGTDEHQRSPYNVEWQKSLDIAQSPFYLGNLQIPCAPGQGQYRPAEHALDNHSQALLDHSMGDLQVNSLRVQSSLPEGLNIPVSHGPRTIQDSQWALSTGSHFDQSGPPIGLGPPHERPITGSNHWPVNAEQDLMMQRPQGQLTPTEQIRATVLSLHNAIPGQTRDFVEAHSPAERSVKSLTPDMLARRASAALTATSFQISNVNSSAGPAESYIDQTLFEYAPFYDFPSQQTPQGVTPAQLDLLPANLTPMETQSVSRLSDEQDRPVPMVGLVGGYFPPEDDMSMYTSPQVNSQGNIRISRLPHKKVSVVYDIPEVSDMTVSQLKAELKKRNIPAIGKKSELQARLKAHMNIEV